MRIISGTHKGRQIRPPGNLPVRPTTDFAKESLFNVLNNKIDFEDLTVLDLFAGTGSISYEFASRGAKEITAIDINNRCLEFIRKATCDYGFPNIRAVKSNVFTFLGFCKVKYDLIFADPPYEMKNISLIPDLIFDKELLNEDGIFILEHTGELSFAKHIAFIENRKYGKVNFSFFQKKLS
jgi:16S rRNA (guanine966-N2)-methyltransferase